MVELSDEAALRLLWIADDFCKTRTIRGDFAAAIAELRAGVPIDEYRCLTEGPVEPIPPTEPLSL